MKKIFNDTFLHSTLKMSLCFAVLSCFCLTNVNAQDEIEGGEVVVAKETTKSKSEKTYEMKSVSGIVTDDATGEPMGGVRIQALGLEKYSTLTEEDGSYKGIKVETLTLTQNKFKKYPTCLAKTNSTVAYIILRANEIDEIPNGAFTYKNSVNLTSLDLSYNKLSKLPWEMHSANLPYLYGVDLSFNRFEKFPYEPLDSSGLTVLAVRSQRNERGERSLQEWPTGIGNHRGLRGLYLGSNDLQVIDDTISTLIYYLDISDNPNITFNASDICYAWSVGAYILVYDRWQNILGCSQMLE